MDALSVGDVFIFAVVVEVDEGWWLMLGVAELVVKTGFCVGVDGRNLITRRRVPVPERQCEGVIADELAENFLVEVKVEPVPRKEDPGVMDLDFVVRESDLVEGAVTVGAVDVGLLGEVPGIVVREGFHKLHSFGVLGDVVFVDEVSGTANTKTVGGGRENKVDDFLSWWAAVGRSGARGEISWAAFGWICGLDGSTGGVAGEG